MAARARRRAVPVAGGALLAAMSLLGACAGGDASTDPTTTTTVASAAATTRPTSTSTPGNGAGFVAAACAGRVGAVPGAAVTVTADRPAEVSGVVPVADGAWVLDDSGHPAELHHVDPTGAVRTVTVTGATNVDWEELLPADADATALWIADTGDNRERRTDIRLYRVPTPGPTDRTVAPTVVVDVTYPDGPHNVEAAFAHDGVVALLTKQGGESQIFEVRPPAGGGAVTARRVGSFVPEGPLKLVTGASLAPDGGAVLIRTYLGAWVYPVAAGQSPAQALATATPCPVPTGAEVQGEAIAFTRDGAGYVTVGEGEHPVLSPFRPRSAG